MKTLILAAALAASLSTFTTTLASAHDMAAPEGAGAVVSLGDLAISAGYARATLPKAPVGGGYLTIVNTGAVDDVLIGASSPVAGEVQLHEMKMEGDVMKMARLADGIAVPAGSTITLSPGGLHLMFMSLKQPLVEGETVPVTLTFAKAGTIEIALVVGPANAGGEMGEMHGAGAQ